jgi:hypothetical protein
VWCPFLFEKYLLLLLPLALQPAVDFGLSNITSAFFPVSHQISPSSHSQHLKISFYFFSPSFPGSSSSSRPYQFLSEDLFLGILYSSILSRWPNQFILCPLIYFTIFSSLLNSSSSWFVLLFHSPFSYWGPHILLNIFLSKISRAFSSFFVIVHVSAPYVTTGLISVLFEKYQQIKNALKRKYKNNKLPPSKHVFRRVSKSEKLLLASLCLSVRIEQLCFH